MIFKKKQKTKHGTQFDKKCQELGVSTLNVVAISKTTKLLLTSCVPHIVRDGSSVCVERDWVHLYSQSGYGGKEMTIMLRNIQIYNHMSNYLVKMPLHKNNQVHSLVKMHKYSKYNYLIASKFDWCRHDCLYLSLIFKSIGVKVSISHLSYF